MTVQSSTKDARDVLTPEQCDRAMSQGIGHYVRCSLPLGHPAHHIAFAPGSDLQAVTWVQGDMRETLAPLSDAPAPAPQTQR